MVRSAKEPYIEPESWVDPFWSFVLGEDEEEVETRPKRTWGIRRRNQEKPVQEPTFLGFFMDDRNANSSSRPESPTTRVGSPRGTGIFQRKSEEDHSLSTFLEAENLTHGKSAWSFLDQPYEISERRRTKQQKNRSIKQEKTQNNRLLGHTEPKSVKSAKTRKKPKSVKQAKAQKRDQPNSASPMDELKLKSRNENDSLENKGSWLDFLPPIDQGGSIISKLQVGSILSSESQSAVSAYDRPSEMTARECRQQKRREKRIERKKLREERKAQKAAAKAAKIGIENRKKGGTNDEDSWLAMFSSADDADNKDTRSLISLRLPSMQTGEKGSLVSASSWLQKENKTEKHKGMGPGNTKVGAIEISEKVWNGITSTLEPWLIESEYDDSSDRSSSYFSTESDDSTSDDEGEDDSETEILDCMQNAEESETAINYDKTQLHSASSIQLKLQDELARRTSSAGASFETLRRNPIDDCDEDQSSHDFQQDQQARALFDATTAYNDLDETVDSILGCQNERQNENRIIEVQSVGDFCKSQDQGIAGSAFASSYHNDDFSPFSLALDSTPRTMCCSIKNLNLEQLRLVQETGIPIHELTREDLATLFPKLRAVSNENKISQIQSMVLGNSRSFEKDLPAHVQAVLNQDGPQSLYEYEYETAVQKLVIYDAFGGNPRELLKVHVAKGPPAALEDGLLDHSRFIVQVEASTVSTTDCAIRRGDFVGKRYIPLPNSPGVDAVGILYRVDAHAERKYNLKKGERVLSLTKWGGNSRYLAVKPDDLVKVPSEVDPAEAACLPETYLSVFQVLHYGQSSSVRYRSTALKGKSFLVIGNIQSNFGRAIGQLASTGGAENVFATAKPKHVQKLVSFGILPVSNDPLDWCARLHDKIDVIISLDEPLTPLHYKVLRASGEVIVMAQAKEPFSDANETSTKPSLLSCSRKRHSSSMQKHYYDVFTEWERNLKRCKADLQYLVGLLHERKVTPTILDRIPLNKVAKAHEMIELKRLPGFIICEPWLISKSRAVAL